MSQLTRDEHAEAAVRSAILDLIGAEKIDRVEVLSTEDQNDEPALSVTVYLKARQERMSGSQLLDAIAAAATALRKIEDHRFPFVTFLAPEDEDSEDTRPAA